MTNNIITHLRRTSIPMYERGTGAASEPDEIVFDSLAWLEDGDRMVADYPRPPWCRELTPSEIRVHYPVYDTHTYEAVGMSLDERQRDSHDPMRDLVLMLSGVVFLVVVIAIYVQRTGGG